MLPWCFTYFLLLLLFIRFTSRIVSPALQQTELQRKYNSVDGNMEVSQSSHDAMEMCSIVCTCLQTRVCAGASEVSVTYRVDECCIELWISLPESYPLQPPSIREGKRVRIDPAQWRKWMLQLNVFVANQVFHKLYKLLCSGCINV